MTTTDDASVVFAQIAKRVATAQTQDDLFVLLAQVAQHFDHEEGIIPDNENFMGSAAEGLSTNLHSALLLRDGSKRRYYRTSLSHSRALQCTVLVTAIEMMLRCSTTATVADNIDLFRKELVPSIPKLLNLFIAWEGGETDMIRLWTISNSIKIIRRIGIVCQEATDTFVESLCNVLRGYNIAEVAIHVEAASAIAYLFDQQDRTARRKRVIEQIQRDSSSIISTLSTAALSATKADADEILTGLFNFAANSLIFRTKMAKRRCTIIAIGKHLSSDDVENRKLALNICKCLLNDDSLPAESVRQPLDGNFKLLINKVIESALNESDQTLQLYAITLLGDAARNSNFLPAIVDIIMHTLMDLVDRDGHDEIVMTASVTYTTVATAIQPEDLSKEVLVNVADFTTLPFAQTRTNAIGAIDFLISANENVASVFLQETALLENFSLIVSYGSPSDGVDAINICRLLARNPAHHSALCQSSSFLNSLVKLVTQEEVIDRTCYAGGIETVLALLSNVNNAGSFLAFPDLLPVLVSLANTVADEELKQKLVSAIVRLSSALLS